MVSNKPLIIPWLIGKINSLMYPGVEWVNDEKTQFRIPWKHGKKQSEDDIKLFENWAIDSGRYDPPDQKRWKRNFRAALNQKDSIRMVTYNRSNSADSHKVFEIVRRDTEFVPGGEQCATMVGQLAFQQLGSCSHQAGDTMEFRQRFISEQMKCLQRHQDNAETDFEVNIYYRGTKVKSTTVTNRFGFCLTSKHSPPESYLEDVILPLAQEKVTDRILIQAVNYILTNLDRGTRVEFRDGTICAMRLGNCRSFWTLTDTPTTALPSPIDKHDYSVLYTLQQFVTELIEFVERRSKESPQYSIWICLGERWPDSKPWREKCIMVEIIPVVMRLLHELSHGTGASSLTSSDLNLEISDSLSSQSSVLSFLRSIGERMDW